MLRATAIGNTATVITTGGAIGTAIDQGGRQRGTDPSEPSSTYVVAGARHAAMQALATYDTGRLLFLGLGTSVGATIIADDTVVPLEIGIMPLSKSEGCMDRLSKEALHPSCGASGVKTMNFA